MFPPNRKTIYTIGHSTRTLEEFISHFGAGRLCSVSRELTKLFEENKRGTLQVVCDHFKQKTVKGEIVIVVAGKE